MAIEPQGDTPANDDGDAGAGKPLDSEKLLKRLALFHYLLGLMTALSVLPLIPYLLSAWEISHWTGQTPLSADSVQLLGWVRLLPNMDRPEYDDQLLGITLLIAILPTVTLLVMHGIVLAWTGRWIARHRRYKTTLVISIFNLTYLPAGTVLSAFTLTALMRPDVKQSYELPSTSKSNK